MKYSILFLNYDPEEKLVDMTHESRQSIIDSSVGYDYELIDVSEKGLQASLNNALAKATGDYFIIVCNDVMIHDKEWLSKLTMPNAVTAFRPAPFTLTGEVQLDLSCSCIPRNVYEAVGAWDTAFIDGCGYDDNDWMRRVSQAGFPLIPVPIKADHLESATFKAYFSEPDRQGLYERNKQIFLAKWPELQK